MKSELGAVENQLEKGQKFGNWAAMSFLIGKYCI